MLRFISAGIILILLNACVAPHPPQDKDGDFSVTLEKSGLLDRVSDASFILLGEKHDNEIHHQVQASILRNTLTSSDAVVFEMLNRDQQPVIDQYLNGEVSFTDLPKALNWEKSGWPDWKYYAPLFQAVKNANALILHGSYPRRELKAKMAPATDNKHPLPEYLRADLDQQIRTSHCDMLPAEMISPMSNIQIAKDKLMADQMISAMKTGRAYLIAGNGHVRNDRGVPFHLATQVLSSDVFALGILEDREAGTESDPFNRFDSVWVTASIPEKDYCAGLRKKFKK